MHIYRAHFILVLQVPKWRDHGLPDDTPTVVNIEWGNFDSATLPKLPEDRALDGASTSKGKCGAALY